MRKRHSLFYHIVIFVLAQIAWLSLLGLWIYWYVSNYIIFNKIGDQLSPQIIYDGRNVFIFVLGLVLLIGLSLITSLIFRQLNVQLRLTNLYDNFIGNVTHELKSPLSSIQLYLETLNKRDVPVEKQKEFVEVMMSDVYRLKDLIDSILEISALEQKKVAHNYNIYTAEELISKLFRQITEQFRLQNNSFEIEGTAPCKIVADGNALKIVFNNLVDNAMRYTTQPVKISVNIYCSSKKFVIEVKDNGIGIPAREQKKIFNKFHRIYSKNIPSVKGTGLGLYWVKEIIRNHGGKISAFSEGENKGSTFRIELPVYQVSKKRLLKSLLKTTKKEKLPEVIND